MNLSSSVLPSLDLRMKRLYEMAESVAASRASVLISGESGTGKEVLARFIHEKSQRCANRFIALNCAAVPEGLLESELFGFERGAFTGADQRKIGKFEQANESTFLLDEVSELPLLLQTKLLRVLQEGEVERLGGHTAIKINTRIVATTNRNLKQMVKDGSFREDLFYRLNVIPLEIPPLRQRPTDLEALVLAFVLDSCRENGLATMSVPESVMITLKSHSWPGNIRELKNFIERSVLLSSGSELQVEASAFKDFGSPHSEGLNQLKPGMTVEEAERLLILKTLEHTSQNRTRAAEMLGISIRTLRNKLSEYRGQVHETDL